MVAEVSWYHGRRYHGSRGIMVAEVSGYHGRRYHGSGGIMVADLGIMVAEVSW